MTLTKKQMNSILGAFAMDFRGDTLETGEALQRLQDASDKAGRALMLTRSPKGHWVILQWDGSDRATGRALAYSESPLKAFNKAAEVLEEEAPPPLPKPTAR